MKVNAFLCGLSLIAVLVLSQGCLKADNTLFSDYKRGEITVKNEDGQVVGQISWKTDVIEAVGMATSSVEDPAQRKLLARRGAMLDAKSQLLEIIKKHPVDRETITNDLMETYDIIKTKIDGVISGAEIVSGSEVWKGGIYSLKMQIPGEVIYEVVMEELDKDKKIAKLPMKESSYTGLLIDIRGIKIMPGIYVNILDEDGNKICGRMHPTYRLSTAAIETINDKKIGDNPLRVKAKSTTGDYNIDIVVGNKEAQKIKEGIDGTEIIEGNNIVIIVG